MTGYRGARRADSWMRLLVSGLVLMTSLGLGLLTPWQAAAQNTEAEIEALALRVHIQNLRAYSYTFWIGGDLGDPAYQPYRSVLGDTLDNWTITGMAGDPDVSAADLVRPTLLNFWASWCYPCRMEFRHLTRIALDDEHAFDILFINVSDDINDAKDFLEQYPDEIRTVLDKDERMGMRTQIDSLPTSLLLDSDGTVLAIHVGMFTPTVAALFDAIAANPGVGIFERSDYTGPQAPPADLLPVTLDEAVPLESGETVSGTITDADFQDVYRFEGRAGDKVTLDMKGDESEIDTYLVLLTADGERLIENDDAKSGYTDAGISIKLPADGTYLVVATRFLEAEGFIEGGYRLKLEID